MRLPPASSPFWHMIIQRRDLSAWPAWLAQTGRGMNSLWHPGSESCLWTCLEGISHVVSIIWRIYSARDCTCLAHAFCRKGKWVLCPVFITSFPAPCRSCSVSCTLEPVLQSSHLSFPLLGSGHSSEEVSVLDVLVNEVFYSSQNYLISFFSS